ncbi:unnamed protein product [Ambrosiozyma monospora]|uniref:Unnamed protein product n=1 Tax=Ambrosiozyma monospora TaxID=43982 RepID=A0A9W6Z205_AMBMO|nr:unnamed protein product [Ambrosiozyma monospora]
MFKTLDPRKTGYISGIAAKPVLEASGLSIPVLGEIWNIADPKNVGKLDQLGFCTAMRLIGHAQAGVDVDPSLAQKVGPLAKFTAIRPMGPMGTGGTGPMSANNTGSRNISGSPLSHAQPAQLMVPVLPAPQAKTFAAMFDKAAPNGILPGGQASGIFMKAKLPVPILEKIWSLVDQNQAGQLTRPQFIVAMHLIQSFLNKSMTIVPTVVLFHQVVPPI